MGSHFSAVRASCYIRQTDARVSGTVFPFDRVTPDGDRLEFHLATTNRAVTVLLRGAKWLRILTRQIGKTPELLTFMSDIQHNYGPGSSVGITTGYGLGGPGIESRWGGGRDFTHMSRPALGPTQPLYNGHRVFPGGKELPGCDADPSPLSSAVVKKEQSYTSTRPTGRTACTEPQCLYKGALYLTFYTV